jgi:hypothetical protein
MDQLAAETTSSLVALRHWQRCWCMAVTCGYVPCGWVESPRRLWHGPVAYSGGRVRQPLALIIIEHWILRQRLHGRSVRRTGQPSFLQSRYLPCICRIWLRSREMQARGRRYPAGGPWLHCNQHIADRTTEQAFPKQRDASVEANVSRYWLAAASDEVYPR